MDHSFTNVLIAIKNILDRNSSMLTPIFRSNGLANAAGDSLEFFIKDMFCTGAAQYQYEHEKMRIYNSYLSWTGNSSNFPDFIVKEGVGVEPKKVNGGSYSTIALNSSYPKDYIYPDTPNIPPVLREGVWDKKEIIYAVGNLNNKTNKLLSLWFAYGNTMIADRTIYLHLINEIRKAVKNTRAHIDSSKELARAKGIDPLKHTNLRVRGMYELIHPQKIFEKYLTRNDIPEGATRIYLIMLGNDYISIQDKPDFTNYFINKKLTQTNISIPDPNHPNNNLDAVLFEGWTD